MALGLENAGFQHIMLNEFDKNAVATLRQNRPTWNVVGTDIRDIDFTYLRGEVDVIEGGFPCQAFSLAGKREGFHDIRGLMFYELARAVSEIRPMVVLGENVKGLLNHNGGMTLKLMVIVLQMLGYRVAYKVLRARCFDVPQTRERVIILAVRKDLDLPILFPREREYTLTLKDAIGDRPYSDGEGYSAALRRVMELVPEGGNWRDLPIAVQREYLTPSFLERGDGWGYFRRLAWDRPSPTLLTKPTQRRSLQCHPSETRPLNVREYARIQTFPDSWRFEGSTAERYKQIGNAVPVNLAYHLGKAIIAMLDGTNRSDFTAVADLPAIVRHG